MRTSTVRFAAAVACVAAFLPRLAAGQGAAPGAALPTITVIGTSPLPGLGIELDKVPSNAQSLAAPDIAKQGPAGVSTALSQQLGSVNLNANQDNPFQPDLEYRGFEASPVLGTPTGLAVYQNGIRLNEPFGDNVNWDLVPETAVHHMDVIPTNPIYGLNALGGALVIDMKNGFNYQGGEAVASGGSFGRRQVTLQYGKRAGNLGAYVAGNAYNDEGFRRASPTQIRQLYADIGAEGESGSFHLDITGADNNLVGVGPTPIQLVEIDRSAVFTSPQKFHNTLLMSSLNGDYVAGDTVSLQGNLYLRSAGRRLFNGNSTEVQPCDASIPDTLCLRNPFTMLFDTSGRAVPNLLGGATPGQNDNSSIASFGLGGSLQATDTAPLFDRDNHLVIGASVDHADVDFASTNELGIIAPGTLSVSGLGIVIDQPDGSLAPVRLETTSSYYGLYASDTFNLTPALAVTLGGRYNLALVHLMDKLGTALSGENRFSRFNPAAGATYKLVPGLTAYVGYAEANRAPTAGEIACSDPARPCSVDNFLTSDPANLKQVVARSYEAGLRGRFATGDGEAAGHVDWNLGLFRTDLENDILNVPGLLISSGFFQNIGGTRRQGIEAGIAYRDDRWRLSANYSLIDATFQSAITLGSPNNPLADATGNIEVRPGNHLPGIPQHRLKLNADYALGERWALGGNVVLASDQYFFGDQSNQNAKLGGYYAVDLHASCKLARNVELFALVQNLFDSRYATFGIFGDVKRTPLPGVANPSDPRFVSVAAPLAAFGGMRVTF